MRAFRRCSICGFIRLSDDSPVAICDDCRRSNDPIANRRRYHEAEARRG